MHLSINEIYGRRFDERLQGQGFAGEQTGAGHFANGSKGGVVFALKLRFDSGLVYDRPYFLDPFVSKLIEYVFGKRDSLPVYMEAKQDSFRRAVEAQTARYTRWLGNQQMDVKIEVWNRTKISLQHLAIA